MWKKWKYWLRFPFKFLSHFSVCLPDVVNIYSWMFSLFVQISTLTIYVSFLPGYNHAWPIQTLNITHQTHNGNMKRNLKWCYEILFYFNSKKTQILQKQYARRVITIDLIIWPGNYRRLQIKKGRNEFQRLDLFLKSEDISFSKYLLILYKTQKWKKFVYCFHMRKCTLHATKML